MKYWMRYGGDVNVGRIIGGLKKSCDGPLEEEIYKLASSVRLVF